MIKNWWPKKIEYVKDSPGRVYSDIFLYESLPNLLLKKMLECWILVVDPDMFVRFLMI